MTLACDLIAVLAIGVMLVQLIGTARYAPEIGYDESAAALAFSLRAGHFGNPIDPIGPFFTRHDAMDAYPPAYYAVSALVFEVVGFGVLQARAVSVLFVSATALLCYVFARRLGGPAAGLFALAAYLYVPLHVYTVVARPDVAVPFFLLGALCLTEWERDVRGVAVAAGALLALAILSHFAALMALPAVVGYLLWSSRRSERVGVAARLAGGALIPFLLYSWLLWPHWKATAQHLVNYRDIGLAGVQTDSWRAVWPIRPFLKHFEVLNLYHPLLLWACVALLVIAMSASGGFGRWRFPLDDQSRRLAWLFVALFLAFSFYPNIAIYGYYGPMYLCVGAVVFGCAVSAATSAAKIPIAARAAVGMLLCLGLLMQMDQVRAAAMTTARGVTLDGPATWSAGLSDELAGPVVVATPHWVFSAAGKRVRSFRILESDEGRPALLRGYAEQHPGAPTADKLNVAISDKYNEINNVQALLAWRAAEHGEQLTAMTERVNRARANMSLEPEVPTPREYRRLFMGFFDLLRDGFHVDATLFDGVRLSSNASLLRRVDDGVSRLWPRISMTSGSGVVDYHVDAACVALTNMSIELAPRNSFLWAHEFSLKGDSALADRLAVVRVSLESSPEWPDVSAPYSFALHYPSTAEASVGATWLLRGEVPPLTPDTAIGIGGLVLPGGALGRDLLVRFRAAGEGGVLMVYATGPLRVDGVTIGLALSPGEPCNDTLRQAVAGLFSSAQDEPGGMTAEDAHRMVR